MDLNHLLAPDASWLHVTTASPAEVADAVAALNRHKGTVARIVRGHKMRTSAALFDEFAAALQFPPYFGENWDALDECLADLGWLPADACLVAVPDAHQVLDGAPPGDRQLFWGLLERVAAEWARPDAAGKPAAGRTFRVLAQAPAQELGRLPVAGKQIPQTAARE